MKHEVTQQYWGNNSEHDIKKSVLFGWRKANLHTKPITLSYNPVQLRNLTATFESLNADQCLKIG